MVEPPRITAIAPSSRQPDLARIKVGRKTVARVSLKHVADLDLTVGREWTDELAETVQHAAACDKAMRDALNRLSRRMLSRRELDRKLASKDHEPAARENVLDRLEQLNMVNDYALGQSIIRSINNRKPAGPRLLEQKLFQRGIPKPLITQLLAETKSAAEAAGDDPVEPVLELARKRLATITRLDPRTRKRRLYAYLARRGYDPGVIDQAFQTLIEDIEAEPDDGFD